jgi:signal transduction histidine kinase
MRDWPTRCVCNPASSPSPTRSARPGRCWALAACALLVAAAVSLERASAQPPLAAPRVALVLDEHFEQTSIGRGTSIFVDRGASLDYDSVLRLEPTRFVAANADVPSFGFSRSAFWLRFEVDNRSSSSAAWLLEIGYPPLDRLDLYTVTPTRGLKHSMGGDTLPFHTREVPYRNVVFEVNTPPGVHTCYLRVQTSGPVTIPMVARSPRAFIDTINKTYPQLWMFYGWMIVMGLYNLFLFFAVRDVTYLYYVMYLASFTLFEAAFNGLAFQYLWPDSTWWTNRCNPALIALSCVTGAQFIRSFINTRKEAPRFDAVFAVVSMGGGASTIALALLAPGWLSIRFAVGLSLALVLVGFPAVAWLAARGQRQARYILAAWSLFLSGAALYLLTSVGVLAVTPVTEWTIQIGAAAEVVLFSLGLADRINVMRSNLSRLNLQLEGNVDRLTEALEQAEQARKAKNAFLASVSHELRTPLNAIINIPEGLLEWFRPVTQAQCGACDARFEFEQGEALTPDTLCPECGQSTLRQIHSRVFEGDPTSAATHLEHLQRAGSHLLDVVTDILDVSKLEAGRMRISLERLDLGALLRDTLEPMQDFASTQGVSLELLPLPNALWVDADRVKVKQIVLNLVSNAIKFSDGRGTVRVTLIDEATSYRVGVHDQGIGVRDQDKQRIFEGFEQAGEGDIRRFGGTGLGLSISKQLIQLHHGEIWLESVFGKGSDFYFRIPKAALQPMPTAHTLTSTSPTARQAS